MGVAPLVGAWIEIEDMLLMPRIRIVAPLVGAWIEIYLGLYLSCKYKCRSPRGSVD